ncbi:MAG: hypothetical protein R3F65_07850 [bacterium]
MRAPIWVVAALVAACGGEGDRAVVDAAADAEAPDGGGTDAVVADAGCPAPADAPPVDTVSGRLLDETGAPLVGQVVLGCMATICLTTESGFDGAFAFAGYDFPPGVELAIKTVAAPFATPRRAAALYPYRMGGCPVGLATGALRVPHLPAFGAVIDRAAVEQTVEVGDGLALTLRVGEMRPPLGYTLDEVAARRVPVEWLPPIAALGDEVVVAVYALHPLGATSAAPIGARLPSDLPAGTRVWFRTLSDLDGTCSAAAAGTADGAAVATDPGEGIGALTWLVVSRAPDR